MLDSILNTAHLCFMKQAAQSDEAVVDKARRALAAKRKLRWVMLGYATMFLGISGYFTSLGIQRIENLDAEQIGRAHV